jgi:hypothetical protein
MQESMSVLSACIFKASHELEFLKDRECVRTLSKELEGLIEIVGIATRAIGKGNDGLDDPSSAFDRVTRDLHMKLVEHRKKMGLPLIASNEPTDSQEVN